MTKQSDLVVQNLLPSTYPHFEAFHLTKKPMTPSPISPVTRCLKSFVSRLSAIFVFVFNTIRMMYGVLFLNLRLCPPSTINVDLLVIYCIRDVFQARVGGEYMIQATL